MKFEEFDLKRAAYLLEEDKLLSNLKLLEEIERNTDVQIIMALKACALWPIFPLVGEYLSGATASSLNEAKLIHKHMGLRAHTYAPVYFEEEMEELLTLSSHIVFNSINQYQRYKYQATAAGVSMGLRVNPGWSDVKTDKYNPAIAGSRLGIEGLSYLPEGIDGLHFHALCESSAESLEFVLLALEERFGPLLQDLKWLNMGGGHLITHSEYDRQRIITLLRQWKAKYNFDIIIEPGAALFWDAGILVAHIMDIVESGGIKTLMLDVSFTAHMPDTLEMPYNPRVRGARPQADGHHLYRLGGTTCLAGDYIGPYAFDHRPKIGDTLVFEDMIHYTLVKTTMFNGVPHPDIGYISTDGKTHILRTFDFSDFERRMG